tara:strand:- start:530 stop:1462 length:933 start_codon:yes stop_codon:yes gene_type:complete
MTNISAYLCNTYENLSSDSWQALSELNIRNYCSKHNIPISVITFDDDRVQRLISATIKSGRLTPNGNPMIRKIFRLYDFLESGDDQGLFIDLDTIIINKHIDVRSCIKCDENYMEYGEQRRENIWKRHQAVNATRKKHNSVNYTLSKYDFVEHLYPKANKHFATNSGFAVLTREFCLEFINYLDNNFLNFNKEEHILSYYNNYPNLPYVFKNSAHCSDEFLFDAYLRYDEKIVNKIKRTSTKYDWQPHRLCTHSGANTTKDNKVQYRNQRPDFEEHTLQYFFEHNPIFHHTLKEKNADVCLPIAMRMFSV